MTATTLAENFKHLDLKEIASRVDPRGNVSSYLKTKPGRSDWTSFVVAMCLKDIWAESADPVRMDAIEATAKTKLSSLTDFTIMLPTVIKRLARIGQLKLDFDRDGVLIAPGRSWIET